MPKVQSTSSCMAVYWHMKIHQRQTTDNIYSQCSFFSFSVAATSGSPTVYLRQHAGQRRYTCASLFYKSFNPSLRSSSWFYEKMSRDLFYWKFNFNTFLYKTFSCITDRNWVNSWKPILRFWGHKGGFLGVKHRPNLGGFYICWIGHLHLQVYAKKPFPLICLGK